jgi:iron complex outermembrane receptor protein
MLFLSVASMAATSYAQQTKFTMKYEQITIAELFQKIEESSEFIFIYSEKTVNLKREVSISVEGKTVNSVLDQLFEGTNNYYVINDRQISILSKKEADVPEKTNLSKDKSDYQPQKKTITGKVTDSKGEALPGVTVVVKGTTIGITTDFNGNYTLEIPANAEILSFSFVGMKSQEIVLAGQTQLNVVLEDETFGIDEVVAIGYGVQKKSNVTGAIASVSSED